MVNADAFQYQYGMVLKSLSFENGIAPWTSWFGEINFAGKLDKNLKVTGSVLYNGQNFDKFYVQRTSA
ncbi:unnamed protein product [Linum trigynum]|uniref:Uncharacterized protein n=1 Tax=Linum trigynum TaxID=586398 RepID=A0AAV2D6T3_9ROSI